MLGFAIIISFICGFISCLALIWCGTREGLSFREMMDTLMQKRRKDG